LKKYLKAPVVAWFYAAFCTVMIAQMVAPPATFAAQPVSTEPHQCAVIFDSDFDRMPGLPAVTNYTGACDITATTALLTGKIISRGCPPHNVVTTPATVHIFWGIVDGGNTAAKWQHDVNLGIQPGSVFAAYVSGLTATTTYYYRSYMRNSAGAVWADSSSSLVTAELAN